MHNGVFATLRQAVAFHATRDATPARWYAAGPSFDDLPLAFRGNVAPLASNLDEHGIDAIVAFLGALEDGFGPSRIPAGR
jgi:cytochrome c peroxidase